MKRVVAVDLDGFLTNWEVKGKFSFLCPLYNVGLKVLNPPSREKNIAYLEKLKLEGFEIVILTSRPEKSRKETEKWLKKQGVEYDLLVFTGPGDSKKKKKQYLLRKGISFYYGSDVETVKYLNSSEEIYALVK